MSPANTDTTRIMPRTCLLDPEDPTAHDMEDDLADDGLEETPESVLESFRQLSAHDRSRAFNLIANELCP